MRASGRPRSGPWIIWLGALVSFAMLAAACGTAPAAGGPTGIALARAHHVPPAGSRAEATAYARRLLASLQLPPGARQMPWPARLPAGLTPETPGVYSDLVDLKVLYRLSVPMGAAYSFLLARHPAGTTLDGKGQESIRTGAVTAEFADFTPVGLPGGIFSADLNTVIKPGPRGGSLLRADVFVAWYPPRGTARRINPAGYRAVTVRWENGYAVLRSRHAVLYFARLYNGLRGAPKITVRCPPTGSYQIVFSPAHGQPKVAVSPANCLVVNVSIGGRQEPQLYPATVMLNAAKRAVHGS